MVVINGDQYGKDDNDEDDFVPVADDDTDDEYNKISDYVENNDDGGDGAEMHNNQGLYEESNRRNFLPCNNLEIDFWA